MWLVEYFATTGYARERPRNASVWLDSTTRGSGSKHTRGDALGFFRSLIGATIGFAIAGPVGLVAGPLIAHDTSGGSCDGSDVGDSGSGLGDTMD